MDSGSLVSVAAGAAIKVNGGRFLAALSGTFVGTAQLEKQSPDGTWRALSANLSGGLASWTAGSGLFEINNGAPGTYRWNCTAWTSGSLDWIIDG